MSITRRIAAIAASVLLATTLGACGGGGSSEPEQVANYHVDIKQPFEGREPRDPADLEAIVDKAYERYQKRSAKMKSDAEESELAKKANSTFNEANQAYREGDYAQAQKLYRNVIKDYPLHYGANVNLTLALLQQEKNEDALVQALSCMELSPGETGIMLNIQAAGVACGFSVDDLETAMDMMLDKLGRATYGDDSEGRERDFGSYYVYNKVWDHIETDLYAAEADDAESAGDAESEEEAAQKASKAVAAARLGFEKYEALGIDMEALEGELTEDTDVAALRAYLTTVGLQKCFEVEPTLIEPTNSIPFTAVDNDMCKVRVVSLDQKKKGERYRMALEITNKTEDVTFSLGKGNKWTLNGDSMLTELEDAMPVLVEPGETRETAVLIGYVGDAEVKSVTGEIVFTWHEENSILAHYPISWEAAAGE